ncbi:MULTISPECIES: RNA-guided endonuclease InsQ/TnpB family protein [Argonema]|uniref:RNA-guided endonuclease InsQ/TnpB family protein n=1 Tax=Argonema TaxID=2942761 RepID=UPI00201297EC|nr:MULTISPECIES: transposase [Argonema]MCL1466347.1 transposase [Argonema galeatum A003/A1]MCL1469492.1 transposase [Argonema antarcticum A004/B2]
MLIYEAKLKGTEDQYRLIDEMLRTGLFVRNKALRYWIDNPGVNGMDLNKYCKVLADNPEFPWVKKLNSMARQAMAERAWLAISRFFSNCQSKTCIKRSRNPSEKKGYPRFRKLQNRASIEYKTCGWKLSSDRRYITFTDGFKAGTFKLWGTRDLHFYQSKQIKRVRIVRKSDGYYAQFCLDYERKEKHNPTGKNLGIDVGLNHLYTDSEGKQIENPRFLRKAEKSLKKAQRKLSRTKKWSKNRSKARNRLGRKHLKVERQRKDFVVKLARALVQSSDLVAFEDLQVRNMVKNHHLAKSINDASWSMFRSWLEHFGKVFDVTVIAVPPHYTSQNCSQCHQIVKKSLSVRTHQCPHCGHIQDRDWNAAINILNKALSILSKISENTVGQTGINASGEIGQYLEKEIPPGKSTRRKRKSKEQSLESPAIFGTPN